MAQSSEEGSGSSRDTSEPEELGSVSGADDEAPHFRSASERNQYEQSLRLSYRDSLQKIHSDRGNAGREGSLDLVREDLELINDLFDRSRAIGGLNKNIQTYDARTLSAVTDNAEANIRSMELGRSTNHVDMKVFFRNAKRLLLNEPDTEQTPDSQIDEAVGFGQFDFIRLGARYLKVSKCASVPDFLKGPLLIEKKQRNFKKRAISDLPLGDAQTADVATLSSAQSKQDDTTVQVMNVFKVFKRKVQGNSIDVYRFFIHPHSFAQTIENMFYMSFLIRDGRLYLTRSDERDSWDLHGAPNGEEARDIIQLSKVAHQIFKMDFPKWQLLIKTLGITEPFLEDRGY